MKRALLNWGIKLCGLILLVILLRKIDLAGIGIILKQFHWQEIILLEVVSAIIILTKALRFKILAGRYHIPLNLKKSLIIYGSSMFFSTITPGRLGDFIKVYYLKNLYDCSLKKGVYLSLVDRLFDLITIAAFALLGLALFVPGNILLSICSIGLIIILSLFMVLRKYYSAIFIRIRTWFSRRFNTDLSGIELKQFCSRRLLIPGFFSLIPNGLIFLQMIGITYISGIALKPWEITGILALGNLLSMLPVTVSGLGTRDATFIFLMSKLGIGATQAMSLSLAFFLFNNLGILFFGLLLFLIFKPQVKAITLD